MIKTRAKKPYSEDGKTNFPARNKSGVYLIYKAGKLRYVGQSGYDVYKTMYRHFQDWNDKKQTRIFYKQLKDISVRVIYCSPAQAKTLERAIILKYKPTDNPDKLELFSLSKNEQKALAELQKTDFSDVPF